MAEVRRSKPDAFKQLEKSLKYLQNAEAKVGWFDAAKYEDGTPIAYVAAIHEFGCPEKNIPPRLGMRFTVAAKKSEWQEKAKVLSKRILNGKITGHGLMDVLAAVAEGDFVDHIGSNPPPPLKPETLASRRRRGRGERTMNDSGLLISTLTSVISI